MREHIYSVYALINLRDNDIRLEIDGDGGDEQ